MIANVSRYYHACQYETIANRLRKSREDKSVEFPSATMSPVNLLPGAINELMATVTDTHRITKADRYGMMAAILDESISDEERGCLDRLIRSLVKGRIQVADELSIVM